MADKIDFGERFIFLDSIKVVVQGGAESLGLAGGATPPLKRDPSAQRYLESINWDPAMRNANKWYDRMATAIRLKDRAQRQQELSQIELDIKALKVESSKTGGMIRLVLGSSEAKGKVMGDILICLLMPAVNRVQSLNERAEQGHANALVAFALAAYQRENGRYPMTLEDLAPKYLPRIPNDLFTQGAGLPPVRKRLFAVQLWSQQPRRRRAI